MSILDHDLREAVQAEVDRMRNADRVPKSPNEAETEVVENFYAKVRARDFTFESDEPARKVGGSDRGPRPLEYFLAGLNLCQQAIYVQNSLEQGLDLDALSISVSGDVDPRGTVGIGDVPPGFVDDTIEYTTNIETNEDRETIAELVKHVEHHCPAHATLRTPMSFDRDIVVNGTKLDL